MTQYPPPDLATRAPGFSAPAGACDTHLHVFGPADRYPQIERRAYDPYEALDLSRVQAMHAALGIERAVIVTPTVYGTDNRVTVDALRAGAGRYRGIAVIDDGVSDAALREMDDAGMRGIRFNFARFLHAPPSPDAFRRGVDRAGALGWHVVIHAQADELLEFESLFRDLTIPAVFDHMAHIDLDDPAQRPSLDLLLDLLKPEGRYVKVSNGDRISKAGPPFDDVVALGRALVEAAPDRCLWATDWPHVRYQRPATPNDGDLLALLGRYAPDEAARNRILVDNPARLYGF